MDAALRELLSDVIIVTRRGTQTGFDDRGNPEASWVTVPQGSIALNNLEWVKARVEPLLQAGSFTDLNITGVDDREVAFGQYTAIVEPECDVKERDRVTWQQDLPVSARPSLEFEVTNVLYEQDDNRQTHHLEVFMKRVF